MKLVYNITAGIFLLIFGCVSLFMTSSIFFDWFGVREMEGHYVLFVVWANFICAFLYIFSSYGFFKQRLWTPVMMGMAFGILVVAFIGLLIHIYQGGIYEQKTIAAMSFRTSITFLLFWLSYRMVGNKHRPKF